MKKEKKLSYYKKAAWDSFSIFIRIRDCLLTTNDPFMGVCSTCGAMKAFKELQAGHFADGRTYGVLFDERGVNIQCVHCNIFLRGNKIEYNEFMLKKHGRKVILDIRRKQHITVKMDRTMLKGIKEHYDEQTKKLLQFYHEGVQTLN